LSDKQQAIVLLSGGLDSAVTLAICREQGFTPHALTINYGQRQSSELDAARRVAEALDVARHIVLDIDLTQWGGSSLTTDQPVPTDRTVETMAAKIPSTYVPARNTIFLSLAMGWAEAIGTEHIFIGAHAVDYSGYPDCRPEYFEAFTAMANRATRSGTEGAHGWRIHTPLLQLDKATIIQRGAALGVPFELTRSCYQQTASDAACGICDACIIRRRAFDLLGLTDPITYTASDSS
jgi:7-cyano-7-deazaguanine synthase